MTRAEHIKRIIELLLTDPSAMTLIEAFDNDVGAVKSYNLKFHRDPCGDGIVFDSSVADILLAYNNYWQTDITEDEVQKLMVLI